MELLVVHWNDSDAEIVLKHSIRMQFPASYDQFDQFLKPK